MKIKPVKSYKKPEYPKKESFISLPKLLTKYIPDSWQKNKLLAIALGIFALGNCGDLNNQKMPDFQIADNLNAKTLIAPVFLHGDGLAAIGGIAMTPTVIMTEDDARRIIEDELNKANIILDKKNVTINDVSFDSKIINYKNNAMEEKVVQANKYKLCLDGLDSKHNIGYEFVSIRNYSELGGVNSASTRQEYNLVKVAQGVKDKLQKYGKLNAVVFYDPMPVNKKSNYNDKELRKESEELLREQVKDFVKWLKKEGLTS